jgi:hypothetical protein
MSPNVKFTIKCVGLALSLFLTSLQASLPGLSTDDLVTAVIAGAIGGLGYAGIGAATTLEEPGK